VRTRDAFDETAGAGAVEVVLVAVDDLVDQHAADLVGATVLGVYDVLARKVDLLGRFRARGVRYAVHGSKDEEYALHAAKGGVGERAINALPPYDAFCGHCFTHFVGALSVVMYNHWRTATVA
jgi:hypothetical protein